MPRLLTLTLAAGLTVTPVGIVLSADGPSRGVPPPPSALSATWAPVADQPFLGSLRGSVRVPGNTGHVVRVRLQNARFTALPSRCRPSTVRRKRTWVSRDGTSLVCRLPSNGAAHPPPRGAGTLLSPGLRLLSSPDFLNADVADLTRGPGSWIPRRSANGINRDYRRALDGVLDDWAATDPEGVLVAGDLVNGRWGYDDRRTGNFGLVGTLRERRKALDRAARTYSRSGASGSASRPAPALQTLTPCQPGLQIIWSCKPTERLTWTPSRTAPFPRDRPSSGGTGSATSG